MATRLQSHSIDVEKLGHFRRSTIAHADSTSEVLSGQQSTMESEPEQETLKDARGQEMEADAVTVVNVIFYRVDGCANCAKLDSSWRKVSNDFGEICKVDTSKDTEGRADNAKSHTIELVRDDKEHPYVVYKGDGSFEDLHSFIAVAGRNQLYYIKMEELVGRYEKKRLEKKMSGQDYRLTDEFKTWKRDMNSDVAVEGLTKLTRSFVKRMIGEMYSWMLAENMRLDCEKHVLHDYINQLQNTLKTGNTGKPCGPCPPFGKKVSEHPAADYEKNVCNVISRPLVEPSVVSKMIRHFICKHYRTLYWPEEDKDGTNDRWKYCFCVHDHACSRDYYGELFLWSILYFLEYETVDFSLRLLTVTQNQLSAAMTAYIILRRFAAGEISGVELNEFQLEIIRKKSWCFEKIVKQLLDEMANGNFIYQTLTDKKQAVTSKRRRKQFQHKNKASSHYSKQQSVQGDDCNDDEAGVDRNHNQGDPGADSSRKNALWSTTSRDKVAVAHLVTKNANWGKMSPMMLALETDNGELTAHPLCWKVIQFVWWQGKAEYIVKMDATDDKKQKSKFRKFVESPCFSYILNTIVFLAFLCVYGVALVTDFQLAPFSNPETRYLVLEICVIAYVGGITLEEILQIKNLRSMYLRNGFNVVTVTAIVLYFVGLGLQHGTTVEFYEAARIIRAFSFIVFSYLLLQYMSVFEPLGIMIPMMRRMILQLLKFIAILTMILATFSVATHAIFCPNDAIDSQGFTRIFTQQWMFLFGASSLEDFQNPPPDYCKSNKTYYINGVPNTVPMDPTVFSFAPAILSAQLTLTNIMMLTVIIAMFQGVYDRIKGDSQKYYRHEFLQLTLEYFYRFVIPPPLSILSQLLVFITDYRVNPFGFDGKTYILKYSHFVFPNECTTCCDGENSQDTGAEQKQTDGDSKQAVNVQEGRAGCIAITDALNFKRKQEAIDYNIKTLLARMDDPQRAPYQRNIVTGTENLLSIMRQEQKLDELSQHIRKLRAELRGAKKRSRPDESASDTADTETLISGLRHTMLETFDRMSADFNDLKESVARKLAEQQRNGESFYVDQLDRKFEELLLRVGRRDGDAARRRRPKSERRTTHLNIEITPTPASAAAASDAGPVLVSGGDLPSPTRSSSP